MHKLGFGLMRLPLTDKADPTSINLPLFEQMVDLYMERGFTYFDTAYGYHQGKSEYALREAVVKRYERERFTVTDKLPCWYVHDTADLERLFAEQLERCGVDYFDYYWLHCLNQTNVEIIDRVDGWYFLVRKKAEGKIRHIGFSFHDNAQLLEQLLQAHPEMEYVQLQINYLDWDSPSIQSGVCYDLCVRYGRKVIVMEPLKGGSLATVPASAEKLFRSCNPEAGIASWGIRYCASLPQVAVVLSGMSDLEQVADNTGYMQHFVPLTADEHDVVDRASAMIKATIAVPCTACHYCTDDCPQQICIPEYFSIYNTLMHFGRTEQWNNTSTYFGVLSRNHGRPSDCLQCGQCEARCPQHIPIIKMLQQVAAEFE